VKTGSIATFTAMAFLFSGCTAQSRVQPQSPECLAAVKTAADRKSKWETGDLKIRENIETNRLKLNNLELEDQIRFRQTGLTKNRKAIALLKVKIEVDESSLRLAPDLERSAEATNQILVNAACKPK
jgi:hypothetical protein